MKTKNIMIVGVGGQGSLLASKLLGNVIMNAGYDVKVSEVHGMSQRGGSVVTYVRYGDKVSSPVIELGEADLIISFELCEAARWLPFLAKEGKMITNSQKISPMPVITGAAKYPSDIPKHFAATGRDIKDVDALALAKEAGSAKAVNVVMMGMLSNKMEFTQENWTEALTQSVPEKFLEMNKKAFVLGRESK